MFLIRINDDGLSMVPHDDGHVEPFFFNFHDFRVNVFVHVRANAHARDHGRGCIYVLSFCLHAYGGHVNVCILCVRAISLHDDLTYVHYDHGRDCKKTHEHVHDEFIVPSVFNYGEHGSNYDVLPHVHHYAKHSLCKDCKANRRSM
jgi:hypothetical protein